MRIGAGWSKASSVRIAAATSRWPGCGQASWTAGTYGSSDPRTASSDRAATTVDASSSVSRSVTASAASPRVAALELMKASASADRRVKPGPRGRAPSGAGSQSRSPSRHSAVEARAVRSPVPIAPYTGTGGSRFRLSTSVRARSTSGSTPEPPAAIWFSLTVSIARTISGATSGPAPAAWLRSSRSPCASESSHSTPASRLAPTPVVRPYTGRSAATSRTVFQAERARSTPSGDMTIVTSSRAARATW